MNLSSDVLKELEQQGAIKKKKTSVDIAQEETLKKLETLIEENKYIKDSINRIKEQSAKGKDFKFVINRAEDGLIKEIVAVPLGG